MKKIITIRRNGSCDGCIFNETEYAISRKKVGVEIHGRFCRAVAYTITGIDCGSGREHGIKFIHEEVWETCTKDNTKVGDTVRYNDDASSDLFTVSYMFKSPSDRFVIYDIKGDREWAPGLKYYEVKIS